MWKRARTSVVWTARFFNIDSPVTRRTPSGNRITPEYVGVITRRAIVMRSYAVRQAQGAGARRSSASSAPFDRLRERELVGRVRAPVPFDKALAGLLRNCVSRPSPGLYVGGGDDFDTRAPSSRATQSTRILVGRVRAPASVSRPLRATTTSAATRPRGGSRRRLSRAGTPGSSARAARACGTSPSTGSPLRASRCPHPPESRRGR